MQEFTNEGTILCRATGLLETGGLKEVPIWYNVYKKYRPNPEPDRNRPPAPQDPIPEIVYKEDLERAKKFHYKNKLVCDFFEDASQNKPKT